MLHQQCHRFVNMGLTTYAQGAKKILTKSISVVPASHTENVSHALGSPVPGSNLHGNCHLVGPLLTKADLPTQAAKKES